MQTLNELSPGTRATIAEIRGDDGISLRLMEMGLLDGEEIVMIGAAPLGDPLEFEVRGYRVSLRRDEASRVVVSNT